MWRHFKLATVLFLAVLLSFPSFVSSQVRLQSKSHQLGLRSEYFSRTLKVGDEAGSPQLASYLISLSLSYELGPGFSAGVLLGYASSEYQKLMFRRLPFSIDFEGSGISGWLAGAEVTKSLFSFTTFEVDVLGQFLACIGVPKEYKIPDLAVPGSVKGNPSWTRAIVGPVIKLTGAGGFHPYFSPCFHYLWGTFSLNQTIDSLKGDEEKKIKTKGQYGFLLGAIVGGSKSFELRAEAGLYPRPGGSDYSIMVQALFGF
ncbi:MAG: hypothetical protein ACUVV5_07535 [Candidatus Aminicenantales bacterium]